jgi:hypothetical protein
MKMYFFEEMPFYLLFKQWTPRTNADLAGAWIAIFALGLLYELLQMLYGRFEAKFWARRAAMHSSGGCGLGPVPLDVEGGYAAGRPLGEGVDSEQNGVALTVALTDAAPACKSCCGGGESSNDVSTETASSAVAGVVQVVQPAAGKLSTVSSSNNSCCRSRSSRSKLGCLGGAGKFTAGPGGYFQPDLLMMDLARGVSRFVLAGIAYLLMLAAMCYHVAIFFAVISGVGVGSMLFGRWRFSSGTAEGYSHCGCGSS